MILFIQMLLLGFFLWFSWICIGIHDQTTNPFLEKHLLHRTPEYCMYDTKKFPKFVWRYVTRQDGGTNKYHFLMLPLIIPAEILMFAGVSVHRFMKQGKK